MAPFRRLTKLFDKTHNLKQAVGLLFVTVLISNVLGLLRDVITANRVGITYGSIAPLDKFYAAFVLPDLLYNILIVGALSSAILPLLVKIDTTEGEESFWSTYNKLLSTGLVVIVGGLIFLYFVMPLIMSRLFPGFTPPEIQSTIKLTQVMLLSPLFFTISQISTSALQAKRHFLAPALAPIVYNAAIIIGAILIPRFGLSFLVVGVIAGAAGHFLIQLPSLLQLGWRFRFKLGFKDSRIQHVLKVMLPRTLALTSTQLLLIAFFQLASRMTKGSISIYQLTDDLQTAPVLLLANSLAVAILPDFSRHFARDQQFEFEQLIGKAIRLMIFIFLPVTLFLLIFRLPIMNLFIAIGHNISGAQINLAATTFAFFVVSLFFQGAVLILARAYFARGDTYRPTLYSVISLAVAWGLAEFLAHRTNIGVPGLSLAFSVGSTLNAVLLWLNLRLPARDLLRDAQRRRNFGPVLVGTFFAAAIFFIVAAFSPIITAHLFQSPSIDYFISILAGFVIGMAFYIGWARMCNLEQWQLIRSEKTNE